MPGYEPLPSAARAEAVGAAVPAVPAASVPVWDTAVRIFHWSLVAGVVASWMTGGTGDRLHETVGYAVAGLIGFG